MRDRIDITGLLVTTVVGALPHEREMAQPLRIDLSLVVDLRDAGRSDELGDTVHYGLVTAPGFSTGHALPAYFTNFRRVLGASSVAVALGTVDSGDLIDSVP